MLMVSSRSSDWGIEGIFYVVYMGLAVGGHVDGENIEARWVVKMVQAQIMVRRAYGAYDFGPVDGIFGPAPTSGGTRLDLYEYDFACRRVKGYDVEFKMPFFPALLKYLHAFLP